MTVWKTGERKLVFFKYNGVEGTHASISAAKVNADGSHGDVIEKKEVLHRPDAAGNAVSFVTFPEGYEGSAYIVVQGSKPGSGASTGTVSA